MFLRLSKLVCVVENSAEFPGWPFLGDTISVKLRLLLSLRLRVKLRLLLRGDDLGGLSVYEVMKGFLKIWDPFFFFCWMSPLNKETLKKSLGEIWSSFATVKQHKLNHYKDLFYCHLSVFVSVSPSHTFDNSIWAARIYPSQLNLFQPMQEAREMISQKYIVHQNYSTLKRSGLGQCKFRISICSGSYLSQADLPRSSW